MENVLIGGLSGAIMQGRGKFLENKKLQENTQQAVSSLNKYNLSDFTKETLDSINRGTTLQEEREKEHSGRDRSHCSRGFCSITSRR